MNADDGEEEKSEDLVQGITKMDHGIVFNQAASGSRKKQ